MVTVSQINFFIGQEKKRENGRRETPYPSLSLILFLIPFFLVESVKKLKRDPEKEWKKHGKKLGKRKMKL